MSVGAGKFISSGADAEIRSKSRVVELRFSIELGPSSCPNQSSFLLGSAWVCLGLLGSTSEEFKWFRQVRWIFECDVVLPLSTV